MERWSSSDETRMELTRVTGQTLMEGCVVYFLNGNTLDFDWDNVLVVTEDNARRLDYVYEEYGHSLDKQRCLQLIAKWKAKYELVCKAKRNKRKARKMKDKKLRKKLEAMGSNALSNYFARQKLRKKRKQSAKPFAAKTILRKKKCTNPQWTGAPC